MSEVTVLLSLLELIVLILTAIIISLQFTSIFYSRVSHEEQDEIRSYIPVEMIFVGVAFFGISAVAIIVYLTIIVGIGLNWMGRIGFGSIMLVFSIGVILFGTAIMTVIQDMMKTDFDRDS
ncbi:hypothetical protein [Natronobeatus ordinarius]|uniref:hypothetical protein n=1 Tax=Natronobeatus ordinarius TaxID=2963433 RepID=UPI0020CCC250|nr:hypothetical protein [Natronobeatus ordinarius]